MDLSHISDLKVLTETEFLDTERKTIPFTGGGWKIRVEGYGESCKTWNYVWTITKGVSCDWSEN